MIHDVLMLFKLTAATMMSFTSGTYFTNIVYVRLEHLENLLLIWSNLIPCMDK